MYSFVIQRITWKNRFGIISLENLILVTQHSVFGIYFAIISGWSVLQKVPVKILQNLQTKIHDRPGKFVTPWSSGKHAEYGFGEYGFTHRAQWVFWASLSSGERAQWVPLSLLFVCESELTELCFATLRVCRRTQWGSVSSLLRDSALKTVFRPFLQKCSRRLELSISKNTPHRRWRQGSGSVDPRFPAGLPFPVPEVLEFVAFRDSGNFSSNFPGSFPERKDPRNISKSETWVPKRGGLKPAGKFPESATFLQRSDFDVAVQFLGCCSAAFGTNDVLIAEKRMLQCSFCSAVFQKLQSIFRFRLWHVAGVGFRGVGFRTSWSKVTPNAIFEAFFESLLSHSGVGPRESLLGHLNSFCVSV